MAKCNACLSGPCKNNGTCSQDPVELYRCACPYGYKVRQEAGPPSATRPAQSVVLVPVRGVPTGTEKEEMHHFLGYAWGSEVPERLPRRGIGYAPSPGFPAKGISRPSATSPTLPSGHPALKMPAGGGHRDGGKWPRAHQASRTVDRLRTSSREWRSQLSVCPPRTLGEFSPTPSTAVILPSIACARWPTFSLSTLPANLWGRSDYFPIHRCGNWASC